MKNKVKPHVMQLYRAPYGLRSSIRPNAWNPTIDTKLRIIAVLQPPQAPIDVSTRKDARVGVHSSTYCGSTLVSWLFRTEKWVTPSTTEAEGVAMASGVKEAVSEGDTDVSNDLCGGEERWHFRGHQAGERFSWNPLEFVQ